MPSQQPDRSPREELENYCFSQAIDLQFCQWPEFRLELVNGQFLVGGTLDGSRWLLKEALIGWGLESAIAFAPLDRWWKALQLSYSVSCQTEADWLLWAESLPLSAIYRDETHPPLGSKYVGEHRWIRDYLIQALSSALSRSYLGSRFGPNYGMQLGQDVLTPDIFLLTAEQLSQNISHDYYTEVAAHLIIEIGLPEQSTVDQQIRRNLYERAQVAHYWIVDPALKQFQFWQWTPDGYQSGRLDPDGCYRGVANLSFSPSIFWLAYEESRSPYLQKLSAFTCVNQPRQWQLRKEPGAELSYGSLPFAPVVGLAPQPISPEQFIAWCPETKLEGGPFPLVGGVTGTRNAIALLLMSLGLVETVKLMPGYEWVRVLRRLAREQQQDAQQRERWWQQASAIARRLKDEHGVGGIGVIGSLLNDQPLNTWSKIQLILWDVPEGFRKWQVWQTLPDSPPVELTEAVWALPGDRPEISQRMQILEGTQKPHGPRPQERMKFHWVEPDAAT